MRLTGGTSTLSPRLLLLFAMLSCVLGFGQLGASAAQPGPAVGAPAATTSHPAPRAPITESSAQDAPAASPDGVPNAQRGPDGQGGHALSCGSTVAVVALDALPAPDASSVVAFIVAPTSRLRTAALGAAAHARPPSIATLCVQRI